MIALQAGVVGRLIPWTHWLAVAVAISLPWSTSATAILVVLWLIVLLPTLSPDMVRREVLTAAGGLPVALWLLAALGMLWADVFWSVRFSGLNGYLRLLAIPLLLAQYHRSGRGLDVCYAFLASSTCLLAASWLLAFLPSWAPGRPPGVPVKDYVLQSDIFLICAFGLVRAAGEKLRERRYGLLVMMLGLAALFLANIVFVVTSRTVLFIAPFLVIALGFSLFGIRGVIGAVAIAAVLAASAWMASSTLRYRIQVSFEELYSYKQSDEVSATGLHLAFLQNSLRIVERAPVIGHGTGSIAEQFQIETSRQNGAAENFPTVNPHNQVFAVAIQLGGIGALILFAMWGAHLMLFRGNGLIDWLGLLIVLQNIGSCMFNSHLFDFSQGWLYVFGVGVTGGTVLQRTGKTDS